MIRVIVVDDHQLVRNGFCQILSLSEGIEIVGQASSGEEAVKLTDTLKPDVILMDINMPGIGGIEATRRIRRHHPEVQVAVVTMVDNDPFPERMQEAGAIGYMSKSSDQDELVNAVRSVANGIPFLSKDVAQRLALAKFEHIAQVSALSRRELQVMLLIVRGVTNQEMAEQLSLSVKTISTYRQRIYEKLGVGNDVELTHYAIRHNVVELQ